MPEFHRREFLKLVGASAGAAATVGCEKVNNLIPYVVQPEEIVPGIPVYYASTCQECPAACGLHVKTREGRPIKLEGNPGNPVNQGALCARGQASIGRTYHPDRFQGPMKRGADGKLAPIGWDEAVSLLSGELSRGAGNAWVLGGHTGPTKSAWIDRWVEAVGAGGRVVYEPFAQEALRKATKETFGVETEPVFDLSGSDFVIDFGSEFLESGPSPVEHARQLAESRDASDPARRAARFVYVGPRISMTASNADEWVAAKPGSEGLLALALLKIAFAAGGGTPDGRSALASLLGRVDTAKVAEQADVPIATLERVGKALGAAKAPVLMPPGVALTSRRARDVARSVLLANWALGGLGRGMRLPAPPAGKTSSYHETLALVDAMKGGRVSVLLVHDSNPAYSLPPSSGFLEALGKVPLVVSFASIADETTARAHLVLPDHTTLESWGDAEPRPGIRSIVQPAIRPLWDTRAMGDTLLDTARAMGPAVAARVPEGSFRGLVDQAWADTDLPAALAAGGVFDEQPGLEAIPSAGAGEIELALPELEGEGAFTLVTPPSPLLYDGRGANLPWLQEIPDPVTKVAWDSWAELSPRAAEQLGGLGQGDVIRVETGAGSLEVPVVVKGGLRDDIVSIAIGRGHTAGHWSSREDGGQPGEARGVNVIEILPALTDESGGRAWLLSQAKLSPVGRHVNLPFLQDSQNQRGRRLGLAVTLAELADGGGAHGAAAAALPAVSAEPAHGGEHGEAGAEHGGGEHGHLIPYEASMDTAAGSLYRWGLSIDLDRCTGCSACVAACYVENNIPIVGEEQCRRGRHMAWLRIERWVGDGNLEGGESREPIFVDESGPSVDVRNAPMLCQQCGAAPCEPVCPVIATYHNEDGLNGMIYNRCIGTRYCANNCPYKVRKFNWFDFALTRWPEPMPLMLNPDVTLRGQGVMEKCTFCVQRVSFARQAAKDESRPIRDGEVTTACAQSCPTRAITFGNLKDKESAVVKAGSDPVRGYHSLHELNTRPAITYLAKVKRGDVEG